MNDELIYIDTNCYMDYFENRRDNLRPLGDFAYNLLRKSIECEYKIIISSLVIDELEANGFGSKILGLIKDLREINKIVYSEECKEDEESARAIRKDRKTPFKDTKHAVISHRCGAKFFVTRNMKDFAELNDLVILKYPENL